MKPIRNSAKAMIVEEGNLLTIMKKSIRGTCYFLLPGGGQKHGEPLHKTLYRECEEELGMKVKAGELLFVREYIGRNHEFAEYDREFHNIDFIFSAQIIGILSSGSTEPDPGQVGVKWLPIDELEDYPFYPSALKSLIKDCYTKQLPVYLGDVN